MALTRSLQGDARPVLGPGHCESKAPPRNFLCVLGPRRRRLSLTPALLLALFFIFSPPALALTIERVSVSSEGVAGNDDS